MRLWSVFLLHLLQNRKYLMNLEEKNYCEILCIANKVSRDVHAAFSTELVGWKEKMKAEKCVGFSTNQKR